MKPPTRSTLKSLLGGLAWVLFVIAGLALWFGGGVIVAFGGTDRVLAEMEGFALTVLFVGLGVIAKGVEDHLEEGDEGAKSLGEALRK
jgi:hypothetical protein